MAKQKTAKKDQTKDSGLDLIKELVKTIVYAILIAVGFRTFFYEPFNIPSESMLPTLWTGDYLFVSKMSYGYSRFSLPLNPDLFSGRILGDDVERGDIVVFKLPRDNETDYIKRVIGLPGDRIQVMDGRLFLNGQRVRRQRVDDFVFIESPNMDCQRWPRFRYPLSDGRVECRYPQFRETLPNGVTYNTLDIEAFGRSDNTRTFLVPEGHYFVMGDNRDNSSDSRRPVSVGVGFVPAENLLGRASIIFFSTSGDARLYQPWKWIQSTRTDRFFKILHKEE